MIHTQDISGISIRTVAAEAGISIGSLGHVFLSKADLLVCTMELVGRRAWGRVEEHLYEPDSHALALAIIRELLPLDAEWRTEMEVNVAPMAEAPGDECVREVLDMAHAAARDVCRHMIVHLYWAELTAPDLNVEGATALLYGLVDRLAIHMFISPDSVFGRQALNMIETIINGL